MAEARVELSTPAVEAGRPDRSPFEHSQIRIMGKQTRSKVSSPMMGFDS